MHKHGPNLPIIWILCTLTMVLHLPAAAENTHTEDFTATTYLDGSTTTADWNTAGGELKLFPFIPAVVGSHSTSGNAVDVVVVDQLAYVVNSTSGLQVFDVTDPSSPSLLGAYTPPGSTNRVAVAGDRVYLACGSTGLFVVDVSDPTTPVLAGSYNTPGLAYGVAVEGNLVLVADGGAGLQVLTIASSGVLSFQGVYDTPGSARGVSFWQDNACVADYTGGFHVIDISTPTAPTLIGSQASAGNPMEVAVAENLAYVAVNTAGLEIYNLSSWSAPTLRGSLDTIGGYRDVQIRYGSVFVADYALGLHEIDVFNPSSPSFVRQIDTPGSPRGVAVSGSNVYVADYGSGLQVAEIRTPCPPARISRDPIFGSSAEHVTVDGQRFFLVTGDGNLHTGELALPGGMNIAGAEFVSGSAADVSVEGDLAVVANVTSVVLVDVSNLSNPDASSSYAANLVAGVDIAGDFVFAATGDGLLVLDYDFMGNLNYLHEYSVLQGLRDVQVENGLVYATGGNSKLLILNYDFGGALSLVGSCSLPSTGVEIAIHGNMALVANGGAGLQIIDISDSANPVIIGSLGTGFWANDVSVAGHYAYVADSDGGLQVIDFSDPAYPSLVYVLPTSSWTRGVAAFGDYALIADGINGMELLQIFQDEVEGMENFARSLTVAAASDTVSVVRLLPGQVGDVIWEVSADGGANWQTVPGDDVPVSMPFPGTDLRWRSELLWSPVAQPVVSSLNLKWYSDHGPIVSVEDVPDDQGGWVRINLGRSGFDFTTESTVPVTGYWIHQRVDSGALQARVLGEGVAKNDASTLEISSELGALGNVRTHDGRKFIVSEKGVASALPPGIWEVVGSVPAMQQESYYLRAPTLGDSTTAGIDWSVYLVTTHTSSPTVWFASRPDSGYSVDNIAPGAPQNIIAAYQAGHVSLDWNNSVENDFQHYRIYRAADPDFVPGPGSLVFETAVSTWDDPLADPWGYFYKITVLDYAGNESEAGSPVQVSGVRHETVIAKTTLLGAVPNPFNPSTAIAFELPNGQAVSLRVFDVSGRLVRVLVAGEVYGQGRNEATWNGRDDNGKQVAAGVYFYRLDAGEFSETRRMALVK